MFGNQEIHLSASDTMLAGASPAHRNCAVYQPVIELVGAVHLIFVIWIDENDEMKIAVADMSDDGR